MKREITEKHRENLRISHLGKKFSIETKMKMSEAHRGRPSGMVGKLHSKETKEKMRNGNLGRKWSIESRKKLSKLRPKGENHHWWKGGITEIHTKIRAGIEYRLWREAVFARDSWTCQDCGDNRGGNLQAHHIKPFSKYPNLRFAVDNGITYCEDCYKTKHNNKLKRKKQ